MAGSRGFDDYLLLVATLDKVLAGREGAVIVSGGAKGADLLGEQYAEERGLAVERYLPDWAKYGKGAGHVRNGTMVEVSQLAVFFWDGASKGTADGIRKARAKGIPVEVVRFGEGA